MLIWLNGAFGAGKTQTAYELQRRIYGSFVFDPENTGTLIRKSQPQLLHLPDYQDEPLWRRINFELLSQLCDNFDGVIIVPMTLTNPTYYDEIITRLREKGVDVRHFVLYARQETILRRLRSRFERADGWAAQQIPRCLAAFENPRFENRIATDELNIPQTAEKVAQLCGIELKSADPAFKRFVNRITTQIRVIR